MNTRSILITGIAVILSFIAGFIVANSVNRKEIEGLKSEMNRAESTKKTDQAVDSAATLTDDEVRQAIKRANDAEGDVNTQKNLGLQLYRYLLSLDKEPNWLPDVLALLQKVNEKQPNDVDTLIAIANIKLYIGEKNKDVNTLQTAREYYRKALEITPQNLDVIADIGATYLISNPPEPQKAIIELKRSLEINPKHEPSLQNMVQAFILEGKNKEALEWLEKLKEVNPSNKSIPALASRISPTVIPLKNQ